MGEYKVFWRILFDVIDGAPRLRKEVTLWDHITLGRLGRTVVKLAWSPSETGAVNFLDDRVSFANGGYLICTDMPANLTSWIEEYELAELSETNLGENIAISAEVELLQPQYNMYPIFYYPQDENGSYLALYVREGTARSIHWVIEGQPYEAGSYGIAGDDYWHRVRVRQDLDASGGGSYFEFLVDSMHFSDRPKVQHPANGEFHFSSESKTFYIGRAPDPDDPSRWLTLEGALGHLEFDPNDSCMSCGG